MKRQVYRVYEHWEYRRVKLALVAQPQKIEKSKPQFFATEKELCSDASETLLRALYCIKSSACEGKYFDLIKGIKKIISKSMCEHSRITSMQSGLSYLQFSKLSY